jgi:hypothetical protein
MEHCGYCEKPLDETEKVRWYGEHVHTDCYEAYSPMKWPSL